MSITITGSQLSFKVVDPLRPGERLSTWCHRNDLQVSGSRGDLDFGKVNVPDHLRSFEKDIQLSAMRPSGVLLPPEHRSQFCPKCWLRDLSLGVPAYWRSAWVVSWRTTCLEHGCLRELDSGCAVPSVRKILSASTRTNGSVWILAKQKKRARVLDNLIGFSVYRDRRGVHLESALDDGSNSSGGWQPLDYVKPRLVRLYWRIVTGLCRQFRQEPRARALHPFLTMDTPSRHMINVCTEAIISSWTGSPLPYRLCSGTRTKVISKALGWVPSASEEGSPFYLLGQPMESDLSSCFALLLPKDQNSLMESGWKDWILGRSQQSLSEGDRAIIGYPKSLTYSPVNPLLLSESEMSRMNISSEAMRAVSAVVKRKSHSLTVTSARSRWRLGGD